MSDVDYETIIFPIVDFPIDHPKMGDVLAMLECQDVVSIPRISTHRPGMCYWSVISEARAKGGKLEIGWLLEWYPGVLIRAMHHGVWRQKNGVLLDITAPQLRPPGRGTTTFVPDASVQIDLRWPVCIEDRYLILVDDEDVRETLTQYSLNNAAQRKDHIWLRAIPGVSWTPDRGWHAPRAPTFSRPDDDIRESHRAMHLARKRVLDRYGRGST